MKVTRVARECKCYANNGGAEIAAASFEQRRHLSSPKTASRAAPPLNRRNPEKSKMKKDGGRGDDASFNKE